MPLPEPFRGEVWDVDFDEFGMHPAVVLSINPLNARLGHVAVIPVTGTAGPEQTHVALTADTGLTPDIFSSRKRSSPAALRSSLVPRCDAHTNYDQSYADVTALQPVARTRLLTRRGLLTGGEVDRLTRQLTVYLGL